MPKTVKSDENERKDPTSFLPEEAMSYEMKPKKKKKKKQKEDPFKDIEEKFRPPVTTVYDPASDSIFDPEVIIKEENIEVELDFNDFGNDKTPVDQGHNPDSPNDEPAVNLGQENKDAVLLTFENVVYDKPDEEVMKDLKDAVAKNYLCKVCHLIFQTPKTLKMHQRRKHKVFRRHFTYVCDYCDMSYENKNSLLAHIRRKHGANAVDNTEEKTCDVCALVFKGSSRLRMHMQRKHGQFEDAFKFVCEQCGLTYDKQSSLVAHVKRKHSGKVPVEDQFFNCPFCPMVYTKRETYARHVHRKHKLGEDGNIKKENAQSENKEVSCKECPLVFSSMNYLKLHMRRKHNSNMSDFRLKCQICNLSYSKLESLKRHVRRKHTNGAYCDVCSKHFDTHAEYLSHSHTKTIRECTICGQVFATKNGLGKHLRCIHQIHEPKSVFCNICNAAFHTKRQLKPHYLREHLKVSYTCKFCKKVFRAKESFRRHVLKHNIMKPNDSQLQSCGQCSEKFPDEFELSRHIDSAHKKENSEKVKLEVDVKVKKEEIDIPISYQCSKCPDNYPNWEQLKLHYEQNHYVAYQTQCQVCGELVLNTELQKHIKSHEYTTVKCKYCEFVSENRASMTQHMLRHKNATTYHCDFQNCRYTSFYEGAMIKHKKKHLDQGVKFQCSQCPFQSMNKYILRYHEEAHATGQKRYRCDQCDYSTILPAGLVQHRYKHSTEKRFKCEFCPFATKYNTSLRFHVKKKHCDLPS